MAKKNKPIERERDLLLYIIAELNKKERNKIIKSKENIKTLKKMSQKVLSCDLELIEKYRAELLLLKND